MAQDPEHAGTIEAKVQELRCPTSADNCTQNLGIGTQRTVSMETEFLLQEYEMMSGHVSAQSRSLFFLFMEVNCMEVLEKG